MDPDSSGALQRLAGLLRSRNAIDEGIARLIGRPATPGNIGEWVAAKIFDIALEPIGVNPGFDGVFRSGPLAGKTVNVKRYSEDAGLLDVAEAPADYYLVLTGPKPKAGPRYLPFRLDSIYLFDTHTLRERLAENGVKVGIATSVRRAEWAAALVYPPTPRSPLPLSLERQDAISSIALADDGTM